MARGLAMAPRETPLGEGERQERALRRRKTGIKAALFAVGLCSGVYIGSVTAANGFDLAAPWSPAAALAIAASYLLAMGIGSRLLARTLDEMERHRQYRAGAVAGAVYVIVYPVWFMLWKGGFAVEPIHWAIFILFWFSLAAASLGYAFAEGRGR